jgi:uncharacterized protein YcnI
MVAGALLALAGGGPALAHVTVEPSSATAGAYVRTALRVPHGCSGAATTGISVEIPEGIFTARPMPKPGWRLTIERRRLAEPVRNPHGREMEEEVARITWQGGPLPDEQYDEFVLMLQVPNEPGGTLVLPVTQSCEGGRADAWVERPAPGQSAHDLPRPAPAIRLTPR